MPLIKATFDEVAARGAIIRTMLSPLSPLKSGPASQPTTTTKSYIIGAHGGSQSTSDYRSWRFRTFVSNVYAGYYERWNIISNDSLYLDRAYLSIFRTYTENRDEKEYLCLHCDPSEPDDEPHAIYKQGPHLHIVSATDPLPHAHIPLNMVHKDVILESINRSFRDKSC